MTNEQLAVLIREGHTEYWLQLWEQVKRFVSMRAEQRLRILCTSGGVTSEDLLQSGFLALMRAVKSFDPETGYKLLTYLDYALKSEFRDATGYHPNRKLKHDLIDSAVSLDLPIDNEKPDLCVKDVVADNNGESAFRDIEGLDFVERVLSNIPTDQAEVFRQRYFFDDISCNEKTLNAALKSLRHPRISRSLRQYSSLWGN